MHNNSSGRFQAVYFPYPRFIAQKGVVTIQFTDTQRTIVPFPFHFGEYRNVKVVRSRSALYAEIFRVQLAYSTLHSQIRSL